MAKYRSPADEFDELMSSPEGRQTASFMKNKMNGFFERVGKDAEYYGFDADETLRTFGSKMYEYADGGNEQEKIVEDHIRNRPYATSNQEMIPENKAVNTGLEDVPHQERRINQPKERYTGDEGFKRAYNVDPQFRPYDDRATPREMPVRMAEKVKDVDVISERIFGRKNRNDRTGK